ncbi:TonB-dependent receptor [Lacibacter luteus]|nr:TonB-dependent receptor [Lacibacter luteus]
MKLTILLAVLCTFQATAGLTAQTVTLKTKDTEIATVLNSIQRQGDFRFLYNSKLKDLKQKVSVDFINLSINDVLRQLFAGTTLTYLQLDNNLVAIRSSNPDEKDLRITGKITNEAGEGLGAVSITVKGTSRGTVTDMNGNFALTVPENAVLVISAIGYNTTEINVNNQQVVNVKLEQATRRMDEVVVIGYGAASKRDLTGSITKVSGKDIADKPNINPISSLQGRVAGLYIVNSGTPGAQPDIRLRGTSSFGQVRPLYVVDGIFNDNIDFLNPNDIESIEVLKDPSSLAIFGIRGATGAIVITTKKAKAGQLNINFSSTAGVKRLVDRIDMVDANGFKTLYDEEQANNGVPTNQRFDYTPWTGNTDWIEAMTRTAFFNTNNLSVTASTEKNKFYMGIGYAIDEGVVKHERLTKMFININDELKISKNIKVGFTLNSMRQRLPFSQANGLLFDARRILPITPVTNAEGTFYDLAVQGGQISNPVMNLESKWDKEKRVEYRNVGSVYTEINFLRNFTFRSTFYADMSNLESRNYNPLIARYNPVIDSTFVPANSLTSVTQNNERWSKFQQDHVLTFRKNFGEHGVTATAGFTTFEEKYRGLFGSVRQSPTGDPIPDDPRFWYVSNGLGDPATLRVSSSQWDRANAAFLGRVLYNYGGKYLLNASFRRDGSSAFPNNEWNNFFSVGAAWEVTKESFMNDVKVIDFLKIKASTGTLGVQNTLGLAYPAYPNIVAGNSAVFGDLLLPSYARSYEPDRDLNWERIRASEAGFELYALNNRLYVEASYYVRTTNDLLAFEFSSLTGSRLGNIGKVRNQGIEVTSSWTQQLSKDATLTLSGNITTFNNEVIDLPSGGKLTAGEERPSVTEKGFPIGYFYGYVVEGVYQSYADKLASPTVVGYDYQPGDLKYKDVNGDGKIDASDRTMIGNPTPDFMYGLSANFKYKGFDAGVDFQGVYGNEIYRYWGSSELPFTRFNYPTFRLNRWTGDGTSNWEPAVSSRPINRLPSTYGVEDGSFFRIRNVQLGYNFSPEKLRTVHIKSFRIFVNAQNLKTFKRNSGYTPEFGGSPTQFGIDNGNGPIPVIFTGGINVNF